MASKTKENSDSEKSPELLFSEMLLEKGHFHSDGSLIYKWNNIYWELVEPKLLDKQAWVWLGSNIPSKATPRIAQSCAIAAAMHLPSIEQKKIDESEIIIPLQNGYLHINLKSGNKNLTPPQKEFGLRYKLNCNYAPSAKAQEFEGFLSKTLPNPSIRSILAEFVGSTLIPDSRFQKGAFFKGPGGNGTAAKISPKHRRVAV